MKEGEDKKVEAMMKTKQTKKKESRALMMKVKRAQKKARKAKTRREMKGLNRKILVRQGSLRAAQRPMS